MHMEQYHALLKEILTNGEVQFDPRTEEYTLGVQGWQYRFDLREMFPLVTTRVINPRLAIEELFWKLRGERNIKSLSERNVRYWNQNAFQKHLERKGLKEKLPKHSKEWEDAFREYDSHVSSDQGFAEKEGDLGPVYGYQWRHWRNSKGEEVDQLEDLLKGIRTKPGSRYHTLNAYNPGELKGMAIGPCPFWHQFTVYGKNLDLHMVQRSCDIFLGVPYNDAQDAVLLSLIAKETGLQPRRFTHTFINTHAYLGVPPRSEFWLDSKNVEEFQSQMRAARQRVQYPEIKEWYLKEAPPENNRDEGKDHIPDILTQLSKEPQAHPKVELANIPLSEAINMRAEEVVTITGYKPHKWKTKARMAA